ncbi:hypothetical protein U3A55_12005 [Salarchaeum sp. III]
MSDFDIEQIRRTRDDALHRGDDSTVDWCNSLLAELHDGGV